MDLLAQLEAIVGANDVIPGDDSRAEDLTHDEALGVEREVPAAVVFPSTTEEVQRLVALAGEHTIPLTGRGSGTGLSGACIPRAGGIVVAFERMNGILEIDDDNCTAVVQPGVTLEQLDRETGAHGLVYPVFPGEYSASLGGNVATNAGGMRAVKYGVTRHQVLGVEAVIGTGETLRCGGKFVKSTAGYDLTQLIVGSEGTLALVTEAVLRLYPRPRFASTILAPFDSLAGCTRAVPTVVHTGVGPLMIEYIDTVTMAAMSSTGDLGLGVAPEIRDKTLAYLVVVLENNREDRLAEDTEEIGNLLSDIGALDVYVLPPHAGTQLIQAREKAFWLAKAAGADDILDVVVPRASIAAFIEEVGQRASDSGSWVTGCGHAGDGNVHLSVFQTDPDKRSELIEGILRAGVALGGAVSGEHGIGRGKKKYLALIEDPAKLALWRRIKTAFDPSNLLNPGAIFDMDQL